MIKHRSWHQVPADPVLHLVERLSWKPEGPVAASASTAALMVYVALCFSTDETPELDEFAQPDSQVATATYDELVSATSLSRPLVSAGLGRLIDLGAIRPMGSSQKRRYEIRQGDNGRWFKLPCKAITSHGMIRPFRAFHLRSKHELHAMKLYLYLASIRSSSSPSSSASYETIFERTRIPERDIQRAISHLLGCQLLMNVYRSEVDSHVQDERQKRYGPNRYFLTGYPSFFSGAGEIEKARADAAAARQLEVEIGSISE